MSTSSRIVVPAAISGISTKPPSATARVRLDFLDGIRGIAALFVVIHHAYLEVAWWQAMDGPHPYHGERLPANFLTVFHFLTFGHFAVDTFIVLSGYCLMLPVVRSSACEIPGGFWRYIERRALRILPPYYAALALSLVMIALIPGLHHKTGSRWDVDLPAFTAPAILSHLLLIHNLSPYLATKIDYPMWSVATEWQIYFFFPLLLLPIARRWGPVAPVIAGFAIGVVPVWLTDHGHLHHDFSQACPWYIGEFAMGMLGARLTFDTKYTDVRWLSNRALGSYATVGISVWLLGRFTHVLNDWKQDFVFGTIVLSMIIYCARYFTAERNLRPPLLLRLFESKFATRLGIFSYSLYLVHAPILAAIHLALRPLHWAPMLVTGIMIVIGTSICVAVAYLFHLVFERPFMRLSSRHKRRTQA